jgi:hypothetical protein
MTPSQSKIGSEEPIFASSPKGRAKSACGAKLQFEVPEAVLLLNPHLTWRPVIA